MPEASRGHRTWPQPTGLLPTCQGLQVSTLHVSTPDAARAVVFPALSKKPAGSVFCAETPNKTADWKACPLSHRDSSGRGRQGAALQEPAHLCTAPGLELGQLADTLVGFVFLADLEVPQG